MLENVAFINDLFVAGIMLLIYDLFEMANISSLHCSIYGDMNAQNLVLKGFTRYEIAESAVLSSMSKSKGAKGSAKSQKAITERLSRLYAVLDYCPQPGASFFFTFIVEGDDRDHISMERHEPLQLDTLNADCTHLLREGSVISGCMDGTLQIWDVATQSIVAQIYDTKQFKGRRKHRPAHNGPVT
jgi:hypothetical protein